MRKKAFFFPSYKPETTRIHRIALLGVTFLPICPNLGILVLLYVLVQVWRKYFTQIRHSPLTWGFGILSLWLVLTTAIAVKPISALEGLANFIPYFLVFLGFRFLFQSPSQLRQLAWCIVLSSVPVALLGLGQLYLGWGSPEIFSYLGTKITPYGNPEGRMSSVLMYANLLAAYLLNAFILAWGLAIAYYRQWRKNSQPYFAWRYGILVFTIILNGIGLFLSDSRSAWGLMLLTVVAYAIYLRWYWVIGGIAAIASSVAWAAWGFFAREPLRQIIPISIWGRLSDELYDDRYVTALRSTQWKVAWEMVLDRPFVGWGLRNFTPYYKTRMNVWIGHPHNFFLMLLAEIGIVGIIIFCVMVGWIIWRGMKLCYLWSLHANRQQRQQDQILLLSYLLAFGGCILFNILDVTVFDVRVNLLNWIILSAISGIGYRYRRLLKN